MKCYGIKSKDGKYISKFHNYDYRKIKGEQKQPSYTSEICNAMLFKDYETATLGCCSDMEVVEISILEGDAEKQLEQKDKEIKRLLKNAQLRKKAYNAKYKQFQEKCEQELRHQVCEEIRNFIKSNTVICGGQATRKDMITSSAYNESLNDLRKCLDQIEKGEK